MSTSYFNSAAEITSIGQYGDSNLDGAEWVSSDRRQRISEAADSLCDFVHEYTVDWYGHNDDGTWKRPFKQEDLDVIARMIAQTMMHQFEYDLKAEYQYMEYRESREQKLRASLPSLADTTQVIIEAAAKHMAELAA
jgi:hypothetical protein